MRCLETIVRYAETGKYQHLTSTIMGLPMYLNVSYAAEFANDERYALAVLPAIASLISTAFIGILQLGAMNNFDNYSRVRRNLERYGWNKREISPFLHYPCGRNLSRVAARDAGFSNEMSVLLTEYDKSHEQD